MRWLRSLIFNLCFYGWTASMVVAGIFLLPFPWRTMHGIGRLWARGTMALLRVIVGLDWRIEGAANIAAGPAIYASKHQSTWDTLIFALLLQDPAYVLKRELLWIPFFGQLLARSRPIGVNRSAGAAALRAMLSDADRAVAAGRPIVIFPEGTRTAPGERRPFHPGIAALYRRLDLPVVPVALDSGLYWGRRRFVKEPGTITIAFLPAIAPGLERRAFMAELERRIEAKSDVPAEG
ncbi:MAG: lysophospholipid acyltransferase family protein [Rhodospirillaceae bacterium]|nr:lysophospholipid acyltransferase family protein [Rhodospirillaceae bacterium]